MYYFAFICGFIVALLVIYLYHIVTSTSGVLVINRANPEKDTYRFEIDDLNELNGKKRVIFKIKLESDISQK